MERGSGWGDTPCFVIIHKNAEHTQLHPQLHRTLAFLTHPTKPRSPAFFHLFHVCKADGFPELQSPRCSRFHQSLSASGQALLRPDQSRGSSLWQESSCPGLEDCFSSAPDPIHLSVDGTGSQRLHPDSSSSPGCPLYWYPGASSPPLSLPLFQAALIVRY